MSEPIRGLLLSDDLIFTSRITGFAQAQGVTIQPARTVEQLLKLAAAQPVAGVLLDLSHPELDLPTLLSQLQADGLPAPRTVAYGSHVDAAGLRAARQAGCDLVLPRSAFVERLPTELPAWLGQTASAGD